LAGKLSVTAPVLFGDLHVLPVVTEFLGKHPALDVRLLLLDRVVSLAEEGIDVAVRIGHLPDSSLKALTLGQVSWVLCASPAYLGRAGVPRTLEALSGHDCIAFTATTPIAERWTFPSPGRRERTVTVRPGWRSTPVRPPSTLRSPALASCARSPTRSRSSWLRASCRWCFARSRRPPSR
jgi:DNA-binding transcriptional LysR family regulator